MLAKLEDIAARYDELEDQLSRPETLADMQLYTKLSREHAETEELVQTYRTYRRTESEMNAALAEAEKELGIKCGECTEDGLFSIDSCRCVGACGLAPVLMINEDVHGKLTPEMVKGILDKYREAKA